MNSNGIMPTIQMSLNNGEYPQGYSPNNNQMNFNPNSLYAPPMYMNEYGQMIPNNMPNNNGYYVNPINNSMSVPNGGVTTVQGGFNPVNGVTTFPQQMQGGVPQPTLHSNPFQAYGAVPSWNNNGYMTPLYNPNAVPAMPQNQYTQATMSDILYEDPDITELVYGDFRTVLLSEEEMQQLIKARSSYITGYDYYGNPIYNMNGINSYYEMNKKKQEMIDKQMRDAQKLGVDISRAVHAYYGLKFDEERAMELFNPLNRGRANQNIVNMKNMSREDMMKLSTYMNKYNMSDYFDAYEKQEDYLKTQKINYYNKIKESHDRMIGIEPGKENEYTFEDYKKNGYKLLINIAKQKAKNALRNGHNKYNGTSFRQNMAINTNLAIPSTTDDEYIPIEAKIKELYARKKAVSANILALPDGNFTYASPPKELLEENSRLAKFDTAVQSMATEDQAKRGWSSNG